MFALELRRRSWRSPGYAVHGRDAGDGMTDVERVAHHRELAARFREWAAVISHRSGRLSYFKWRCFLNVLIPASISFSAARGPASVSGLNFRPRNSL